MNMDKIPAKIVGLPCTATVTASLSVFNIISTHGIVKTCIP